MEYWKLLRARERATEQARQRTGRLRMFPPPSLEKESKYTSLEVRRQNAVKAWQHVCRIKLAPEVLAILNESAITWNETTGTLETVPEHFSAWRIMSAAREAVMNKMPIPRFDGRFSKITDAIAELEVEYYRLGLLVEE